MIEREKGFRKGSRMGCRIVAVVGSRRRVNKTAANH